MLLTCRTCKETKDCSDFHRNKYTKSGYEYVCKPCRKIEQAERYRNNWFEFQHRLKKSEAERRNIPYNLDADYLKSIFTDECPVTGKPFVMFDKSHPDSPTLDRLIPSEGYIKGNVVYVSSRINRIKYDASVQELRQLADWLEGATTRAQARTLK